MLKFSLIPLLLLTLSAHPQWLRPQPFPQLRFSQLTEKDGLSCDKTTAITQDSTGLIWISTNNGLNRFDANTDDSTTIPANEIENIIADKKNNLWMQTAVGICRFNTTSNEVTNFRTGNSTPPAFRTYDASTIRFDENDNPYVISPAGLYHFADPHFTLMEEGLTPFLVDQRLFTHYADLVPDHQGNLWSFQQNRIFRIDKTTKAITASVVLDNNARLYGLVFDSHDRCWASSWSTGIFRIDVNTGKCTSLPNDFRGVIRQGIEWALGRRHFLIFPTNKPGLLFLDEQTGDTHYYLDSANLGYIGTPFVDRQNILWIPTSHGVLYLPSSFKFFDLLSLRIQGHGRITSVDSTTPYIMRQEKNGYWVGRRYNGGMLWCDSNWQTIRGWDRVVDSIDPAYTQAAASIREAYDFKQVANQMFITTEWGMMILDLHTMKRTMISTSTAKPVLRLRTIVPVNDHTWWIRS